MSPIWADRAMASVIRRIADTADKHVRAATTTATWLVEYRAWRATPESSRAPFPPTAPSLPEGAGAWELWKADVLDPLLRIMDRSNAHQGGDADLANVISAALDDYDDATPEPEDGGSLIVHGGPLLTGRLYGIAADLEL